ncbi:MAG: DUF3788 family protein [Coprococcus sp.]
MYERMLNKQEVPTREDMSAFCGDMADDFMNLNIWLSENGETNQKLTFPYGNNYGWAITHRKGQKLICQIFPEKEAFTVMIRLTNKQFDSIYDRMGTGTKELIDNKYPCNDGGWIHCRIVNQQQIRDIHILLAVKCGFAEK